MRELRRFINNEANVNGGAIEMSGISSSLIRRSYFYGNEAPNGAAISVIDSASVTVESSVFGNTTTEGLGVIYAISDTPFAVVLDGARFESSMRPALYSTTNVHVQNCIGLKPSDVINVSVGTCTTTGAFCMPEACEDMAVGIDCFCMLDGVTPTSEPLPAGCMEVRVCHSLSYVHSCVA